MAGLRIENLSKSFKDTSVVEEVSFTVRDGEFCIVLGPSGCGKSTLLRMIAGLELQDSGNIYIGDQEVSGLSPKERDVAMVFQSYALYPHMSVLDNMAFSLKMKKVSGSEINRKVIAGAKLLKIDDLLQRKPKELSGGQRQRVAIGRAIVREPKMFLFDEPLSNLDAKLRNAMRVELIGLHNKLNSTVVYVTHDQVEAMTLGQKIVLLNEGKIQQTGTPAEIYDTPANLFAATFIGSPQMNILDGSIERRGDKLLFRAGGIVLDVSHRKNLEKYTGETVTAGIRPESLLPGQGLLAGKVELIEHLGAEIILHALIDGMNIVARLSPDFKIRAGDDISFNLAWNGVHFFSTGERIR
jgi:multiple sugar transport system ATP-binding protein